jgi:cytochrome c
MSHLELGDEIRRNLVQLITPIYTRTQFYWEGDMMRALLSALLVTGVIVPAFAQGDAEKGAKIFRICQACHTAEDQTIKTGPYLKGVVGRKAASVEGYKYSDDLLALGQAGIVWDEGNLDKYLENPKSMAPKGKMAFPGLKKPNERADVIAFLKTKM